MSDLFSRRKWLTTSAAVIAGILWPTRGGESMPETKITPKAPTENQPPQKEPTLEERYQAPWSKEFPYVYTWLKGIQSEILRDTDIGARFPESWTWEMALVQGEKYVKALYPDLHVNFGALKGKNDYPTESVSLGELVQRMDIHACSKMENLNGLLKNVYQHEQCMMAEKQKFLYPHLQQWMQRIYTIEKGVFQEPEVYQEKFPRMQKISLDEEIHHLLVRRARGRLNQHIQKLFSESLPYFIEWKINALYAYRLNEFYRGKGLSFGDYQKRLKYENNLRAVEKVLFSRFPKDHDCVREMPTVPFADPKIRTGII
ncbi:MAG: hypothetical protein ACOY3I_06025 [Verrucomicrobiota bacterium]